MEVYECPCCKAKRPCACSYPTQDPNFHTICVTKDGQTASLTFSRQMIRDLAVDLSFAVGNDYMKELGAIWSTELTQAINQRSAKAHAEAIHWLINNRPQSPTVQEIIEILSS